MWKAARAGTIALMAANAILAVANGGLLVRNRSLMADAHRLLDANRETAAIYKRLMEQPRPERARERTY